MGCFWVAFWEVGSPTSPDANAALLFSSWSTLFASLLNAFAWDTASLVVLRVMTGIGIGAMTVIANTYISEMFPARLRGKYLASILTIGLIGIPATALVARIVIPLEPWGWRCVFVWGSLGAVSLCYLIKLPESPRWYQMLARHAEAQSGDRRDGTDRLKRNGNTRSPGLRCRIRQ